ncbi:pyrimidine/purine-5'-nucleotide nucleosidase [Methylacidimicrobium cyclopophantes]|uniref:AMP nucleosidase n=1 Tax=Methylacidimicrobium cyclopophantes TaxID=1041766 RepID=A0A5E6MFK0_9BACT|nr:LOG family protein [Methylacidimicrobium cyclopophantes]VVM07138.1 pyrimidine/purine-5'-nucleotide nucleosidase [Methylacidimicrobium cyclopophantes]
MTEKKSASYSTGEPALDQKIAELLEAAGIGGSRREYFEIVATALRFARQATTPGDIRMINQMLKEIRYADAIFQPYRGVKKVTIFGSARLAADTPEWRMARDFAEQIAKAGFMVLTGGGDGIMGAAQLGAGKKLSFGLNIRLPYEQRPNEVIEGDRKLIFFRYFFTRKLHFVKESHAIALFPGGFGTMDECFEALTLMQTGKAPIVPMVFIDYPGGSYWSAFRKFLRSELLSRDLISEQDFHLFTFTDDSEEARREIERFYYNFHSYRFVGELLVLRIHRAPDDSALQAIQAEFADIVSGPGLFQRTAPLPAEANEPEILSLPRLSFPFDRRSYGRLRQLIDRLNEF